MNDFEEFENLEEEEEIVHKMNCKYVIMHYIICTCCVIIVVACTVLYVYHGFDVNCLCCCV